MRSNVVNEFGHRKFKDTSLLNPDSNLFPPLCFSQNELLLAEIEYMKKRVSSIIMTAFFLPVYYIKQEQRAFWLTGLLSKLLLYILSISAGSRSAQRKHVPPGQGIPLKTIHYTHTTVRQDSGTQCC